MPLSPKEMARRSRTDLEELAIKSEVFRLETVLRKSKPRKNTRLMEIMEIITERFINMDPKTKRLSSQEFIDLYDIYSPPTIIKAKRMLGVKSIRRDGTWFWTAPRVTPEQAVENKFKDKMEELDLAKQELQQHETRVCTELKELMEADSYYSLNNTILDEMARRGYGRSAVLRAKSKLGIATRKIDGAWCWIWQDENVRTWLENRLGDQQVRVSEIFKEAHDSFGWDREVVKMAKEAIGSVRWTMINERVYWYNLSGPEAREAPDTRVPTNVIQRDGYVIKDFTPARPVLVQQRSITVDFTDVESVINVGDKVITKAVKPAGPGLPSIERYEEK